MNRFHVTKLLLASALAWPACAQPDRAALQAHGLWSNSGAGDYDDNSDNADPMDHNVVVSLAADGDPASPSKCTGLLLTPKLVLTTASCTLPVKAGAHPFVRIGPQRPYDQVVATTHAQLFTCDGTPGPCDATGEPSLSGRDLALLTLQDYVFEKANARHPSLQPALPSAQGSPGQAEAFAQLVFTGWSPLNAVPEVSPFADHRQVLQKDPALLYRYAHASSGNEPFLVLRAFGPNGEVQYGLAAGDSGAPLFRVVGGQWDAIGIASIIGDPADPDLRAQPLPALAAQCAPLPGLDVASECDAWIDLTADSTRGWILQNVRDSGRGPRWKAQHPALPGSDGDFWYGDVDYAGKCDDKGRDPDCDHIFTSNSDGSPRDNCPTTYNPDQLDSGDLGQGDVCKPALRVLAGDAGGGGYWDGPAALARFANPVAAAADNLGHIYVADSGMRVFDGATGLVSALAVTSGDPQGLVVAPGAFAFDGASTLYVIDGSAVKRMDVVSRQGTRLAGSRNVSGAQDGVGAQALFGVSPTGIAWDPSSRTVFVADTWSHTIRQVDPVSLVVRTVAGIAGTAGSSDGIGSAARFNQPAGLYADGQGALYIADSGNATVRRLTIATGAVATIAGSPGSAGYVDAIGSAARFNNPRSLTADSDGNLLIADAANRAVRRLRIATLAVSTVAGNPAFDESADGVGTAAHFGWPVSVSPDGSGHFVVLDGEQRVIRGLDAATGAVTTIAGAAAKVGSQDGAAAAARFNGPQGFGRDASGNLYVADTSNHTIRKIAWPSGDVSTVAGKAGQSGTADGTADAARFNYPTAVTADGAGNLYVTDDYSCIRKIVLATQQVTTLAGVCGAYGNSDGVGSAARFNQPGGLVVDGKGSLFVADTGNALIRQIVIASRAVTTYAGGGRGQDLDGWGTSARFASPTGLATDGTYLFIADTANHLIRKCNFASGGYIGTLAGTGFDGNLDGAGTAAIFSLPMGLTVSGGTLYVADQRDGIRTIDVSRLAASGGDPKTATVTTVPGLPVAGVVGLGLLPAALAQPSGIALLPDGAMTILDRSINGILVVR